MDLKTFIKETLVQIAEGVQTAGGEMRKKGGFVNPRNVSIDLADGNPVYQYLEDLQDGADFRRPVEVVDFDIAIAASEGTESKGGIGIMVGTIGLGSQGKSDAERSTQSRVKFRIPIVLPNG